MQMGTHTLQCAECRLYETVHSLQPEVLQHIPEAVEPFCLAEGMTFGKPQISHGPWKGYLVGVVGNVAAEEDDVLWPNRVCLHHLLIRHYETEICTSRQQQYAAKPVYRSLQYRHIWESIVVICGSAPVCTKQW